ncbi:hypothetical protein [Clostridium sp. CCUG 7971]|nr:hypothetical protein [Clostridium sp. CCUG 7971]
MELSNVNKLIQKAYEIWKDGYDVLTALQIAEEELTKEENN